MTPRINERQVEHYRGGRLMLAGFASVGGTAEDVTAALSGLLGALRDPVPLQVCSTAVPQRAGVVATSPGNRVLLRDQDDALVLDAAGHEVYGRVTLAGAVWTLGYYSMSGGVQTPHAMPAGQSLKLIVPMFLDWAGRGADFDMVMLEYGLPPEVGLPTQVPARFVAVPAGGSYAITDDDDGRTIELNGACTVTIPTTLTGSFTACYLMQMDTSPSTISGTFIGEFGQTATAANARYALYEIRRTSTGTVLFRVGA